MKLVNPANRRKHSIIVVGAGLAGAAAAATLGQQGYHVHCFSYHDTPRRAHSIAAQGGINAAKNYRNDGDSIFRLFKDTVKGGDYRAREANVYRLAQISLNIIDQCVAQGVPFAREYGGLLDNRSFGGVQVSRTFYARGQTGQQLLLGAYQALEEQVGGWDGDHAYPQRAARRRDRERQSAWHCHARPGDRRHQMSCGRCSRAGNRRLL
jgi:succinate dehydrogenase / fumarate reductase flavoprotein subunit